MEVTQEGYTLRLGGGWYVKDTLKDKERVLVERCIQSERGVRRGEGQSGKVTECPESKGTMVIKEYKTE